MGKINRVMLMLIAMVAIMIAAVGIDRAMQYSSTRKWAKERRERYVEAQADAAQIQVAISELSQDRQAIEDFIRENQPYFDEMETEQDMPEAWGEELLSEGGIPGGGISGNDISGNDISGNTVSGNGAFGDDLSGNDISGNTVSGNGLFGQAVSGNDISGNTISGNDISGNGVFWGDVSGDGLQGYGVSGNGAFGDGMSASFVSEDEKMESTLLEKRKLRGSYEETVLQRRLDQETIDSCRIDFSDRKIVCLGDSITEATNLDYMEDYQQYAYPTYLKEILGAKRVDNLGIGGSSIGRYWENAFVDRYRDIPEDADLILVMGGTNDGFCVTQEDFGVMEDRKEGTFIGDLDELMRGLKENYPQAQVVLVTPLPNVLHDMLRKERDYLLPQSMIANAMKQIGKEYDIPVIDLYNSNILDSHDAAVIYNYMPDGVHCNPDGYRILAQHIAAELIRFYDVHGLQGEEDQQI